MLWPLLLALVVLHGSTLGSWTQEDLALVPPVVRTVRRMLMTMSVDERQDPVIVAESNMRFHRMTRWWIDNMKQLGLEKFLLVALDPVEYQRLKNLHSVVAWTPGMNMNYSRTAFRTPQYNEIVNHKWRIVLELLKYGHNVLLTDVDIYWRRNPLPYLRDLPYCDMYLTTNVLHIPPDMSSKLEPKPLKLTPPFNGDGVENWVNTGFCYLHSAPQVVQLVETVLREPIPGMDDQTIFNAHFDKKWRREQAQSRHYHGRYSCAHYGNLSFHILRPDLFQHRYIHEANPQVKDWYIIHFNWLDNYEQKMDSMIQAGVMDPKYRRLR